MMIEFPVSNVQEDILFAYSVGEINEIGVAEFERQRMIDFVNKNHPGKKIQSAKLNLNKLIWEIKLN